MIYIQVVNNFRLSQKKKKKPRDHEKKDPLSLYICRYNIWLPIFRLKANNKTHPHHGNLLRVANVPDRFIISVHNIFQMYHDFTDFTKFYRFNHKLTSIIGQWKHHHHPSIQIPSIYNWTKWKSSNHDENINIYINTI